MTKDADFSIDFVLLHISNINDIINIFSPERRLSSIQKYWVSFFLSMMIRTNTLCWAVFERACGKTACARTMSFILRNSKIPWAALLKCSTILLISQLSLTSGILVIDDTERPRSKVTSRIAFVFKMLNKKTGGYIKAQNLVVLLLVTPIVTIPVGFRFFTPCPVLSAWTKEDKEIRNQRKAGEKGLKRPVKPERSPEHPSKNQIAAALITEFKAQFPKIQVTCILGDAAFGTKESTLDLEKIYSCPVISELRCNQKVQSKNRTEKSVEAFFSAMAPISAQIAIRDNEARKVEMVSARIKVVAHHRKLHVIALRYEGEEDFRYLFCTDLRWRATDIIRAYTYRWLLEVFFSDWKCYEGWGQAAMQRDETGSLCGVTLSLLLDQCLLLHPEQIRRIKANKPACTVGSLLEKIRLEDHLDSVRRLLDHDDPWKELEKYAARMRSVIILRDSKKHLTGRTMEPLAPRISLAAKFKHAS